MNKNIILCGVGGQGTVLASKLIAAAAMEKDMQVMSAETIGMAQKGGSVFSHVRIGEEIYSPMIEKGTADIIIGFEPAEAVRMLPYLKKGGMVIVSADDPGPISSQTEQDTRTFAGFSKLPVFDPSSPEEAYEMIADAFEYSEKRVGNRRK